MLPTCVSYLIYLSVASPLTDITRVLALELPACLVLVQPEARRTQTSGQRQPTAVGFKHCLLPFPVQTCPLRRAVGDCDQTPLGRR